jgi:hypothetical protein
MSLYVLAASVNRSLIALAGPEIGVLRDDVAVACEFVFFASSSFPFAMST